MKRYSVLLERSAERALYDLPKQDLQRIGESLDGLEPDPRPPGARKILKKQGYRIRNGKYRILFLVDDEARLVRVYRLGHRREVCR
jgi:mRNA interferase RelE/StbE